MERLFNVPSKVEMVSRSLRRDIYQFAHCGRVHYRTKMPVGATHILAPSDLVRGCIDCADPKPGPLVCCLCGDGMVPEPV